MPLIDNNVLQRFGTAGALRLLSKFQPARVTARVRDEQHRTAPDHSRAQFRAALAEGWITVARGAHPRDLERLQNEFEALSDADAELLHVAIRDDRDVFTDDRLLGRACKARGVAHFDVPDVIDILESVGELDRAGVRNLVIEMLPDRAFSRDDLDLLGLRDLLEPQVVRSEPGLMREGNE